MTVDLTSSIRARTPEDERLHEQLSVTWASPKNALVSFITDTDHKTLGIRFVVTAFIFFLLGGIEAMLMRIQLSRPENTFLNPDLYNQVFTTHGTTMMFLFAVPVMQGIGIYLVPLMIGTRSQAFPRLIQFAYFSYLTGCLLLYAGFFLNFAPDAGWFAYVPLSGPEFSPGKRTDIWAQMITFTEMSGLAIAVSQVATIFKHRAPGMSLNRMPLFVWAQLVISFMVIFAMPAIMLSSTMLAMDRLVATHFFNPAEGGDAILWQHLFWFFGHPEVYIIFIPATGMVSTIVSSFSRRPVFAHTLMILSLIATGFIGFGVWVHHMFATGLPMLGQSFFTASSIMIVIPSGLQIFSWLTTLWAGRLKIQTPLLFVFGFIFIFVMGGLTGVMLASVPLDWQLHDTFFVVAHFHYVLIGGALFPLFGAIYYWYPKVTGRMMNETLGRWNFWLFFIGFNMTFFPMHYLGLIGMPRRVYTYLPTMGWGKWNMLATVGASIIGLSVLVFLVNVLRSRRRGVIAGDDPWESFGLEWATASPPPAYNFLYLPVVTGRYELWSQKEGVPVIGGLRSDAREILVTNVLDAEPDHKTIVPHPTPVPFLVAVGSAIGIIIGIFTPWGFPLGIALCAAVLIFWFWPRPPHKELLEEQP